VDERAHHLHPGLLGLLISWYGLFVWLAGMTEGWLAPWDTTSLRPAIGTWPRTVNDFFEGPPGSLIPSWTVLGISAGIFALRVVRGRDRRWLPWSFAALNLGFVVVTSICSIIAWHLPALDVLRAEGVAPQHGYERTWAPLGVALLLLLALFLAQATLRVERRQPSPLRGWAARRSGQ